MTNTIAHDSATCTLGPDGGKCEMCAWAGAAAGKFCLSCGHNNVNRNNRFCIEWIDRKQRRCGCRCKFTPVGHDAIEQSAAAVRARRAALLERADIHSPTEGAIALAEAYLNTADWFQQLPNNAMQDAAVLELAGRIETVIGEYLNQRES